MQGKEINNLEKTSMKLLYESFVCNLSNVPTAQNKYDNIFNTQSFKLDLKIYIYHLTKLLLLLLLLLKLHKIKVISV